MTVNCARIIHGNQVATNGVVHVIDRVISAVGNTIKEVLDVNEDLYSFNVRKMHNTLSYVLIEGLIFHLFSDLYFIFI